MKLLHQAITTPILFDFYNYDVDKKEFAQLFVKFTQVSQWMSLWIFVSCIHYELAISEAKLGKVLLSCVFCTIFLTEPGTSWRAALLYRHEELYAQAIHKEEGGS